MKPAALVTGAAQGVGLASATLLAERGYAVPVVVQEKWTLAAGVEELTRQPGFADVFLPKGRAPHVGERFAMPAAARTLREIARTQGESFYRGEVAQAIAAVDRRADELGIDAMIVTRGGEGSHIHTGGRVIEIPASEETRRG